MFFVSQSCHIIKNLTFFASKKNDVILDILHFCVTKIGHHHKCIFFSFAKLRHHRKCNVVCVNILNVWSFCVTKKWHHQKIYGFFASQNYDIITNVRFLRHKKMTTSWIYGFLRHRWTTSSNHTCYLAQSHGKCG